MGRRGKIDEYKLAEHLKTGVTDKQAGVDFGNIVSRQSITLKRAKFEKLNRSDPRWLPPRAELVISKRGRRRKSLAQRGATPPSKALPDYQLREYIELIVGEKMKAFFSKIASIDELTRERDIYKERCRISEKRLSEIGRGIKEYQLARQQEEVAEPLLTEPLTIRSSNLTEHIHCAPVKITKSELNKLPLLNIREGAFLFIPDLT